MRKSFSEEGDPKGGVVIEDHTQPQNYSFEKIKARPFVTIEEDLRNVEISPTEALKSEVQKANTENAIVRVRYRASEDQPVDERVVEQELSDAHKITSIEREIKRDRDTRSESSIGADASLESLIREFAESRGLKEIEDELVETAGELREET